MYITSESLKWFEMWNAGCTAWDITSHGIMNYVFLLAHSNFTVRAVFKSSGSFVLLHDEQIQTSSIFHATYRAQGKKSL